MTTDAWPDAVTWMLGAPSVVTLVAPAEGLAGRHVA